MNFEIRPRPARDRDTCRVEERGGGRILKGRKNEGEKGREETRGEKEGEGKKRIPAARRYARKRARVSLTKICRYFRILVCR